MSDTNRCACCNADVAQHKLITCCVCKRSFNHSCVDLSASDIRIIKAKKSINWSCRNCSQVTADINELRAVVLELKHELANFKVNQTQNSGIENAGMEEIIHEIQERDKRKKNIIIYNVAKSNDDNKNSRISFDKSQVKQVLDCLSVDAEVGSVTRLGRFDASKNKPRPMKVSFPEGDTVLSIIKKAGDLRNNANLKHIGLSFDRTPRQISHYRELKRQLDERVQNGETNLRIKYVNGIQKIVHLN